MKNDKKTLNLIEIIRLAQACFASARSQVLILTLLGFALPQLMLSLVFDLWSGQVVQQLRELFQASVGTAVVQESAANGALGQTGGVSYHNLIAPALPYVSWFTLSLFSVLSIMLASYLGLIDLAVRHQRAMEIPSGLRAWFNGVGLMLRGGFFLAILILLFVGAGQALVLPPVLLTAIGLMVPVIWIAERRGVFHALGASISLRYARPLVYSIWQVLVVLFSIAAIFYIGLLTSFVAEKLLRPDLWARLPRALFTQQSFCCSLSIGPLHTDFGLLYVLVSIAEALAISALASVLALLTTTFYFMVKEKRDIAVV